MATAEVALTLPVVVLVGAAVLSGLRAGTDHLRCVEAARVAARELARGTDPGEARTQAGRVAPSGASVTFEVSGSDAVVTVRVTSGGAPLPQWTVEGTARTPLEQP